MLTLKFRRLHPAAKLPTKAHPTDAGWDLYAVKDVEIWPNEAAFIPLGVAWECPPGWYAQLVGRSGMARHGIAVLGGVVDCDYRGEWAAVLVNTSPSEVYVTAGSRLCQFVLVSVPTAEVVEAGELAPSERGGGGFGSTGR